MSIKRIGSIKDYTPNFKIIIPRFDLATWHDYIEENFRNIDALFFNLFGINNYSGSWKQITEYKQGQVLFIPDDRDINDEETIYSGRLVKVLVDHVTDNSDYFNVFYNSHPEYYELFADASSAQIFAQQAQEASKEAKNSENVIIQKQTEINDTITEFNANIVTKTEELSQQIAEGIEIVEQNTQIAVDSAEKSRIWAEGEQAEVQELGGELSSMGAADLAYALSNAPEDQPIDASPMFALKIFKGEKGDKGDKGDSGKDGIDGKDGKDGGGLEIGDIAPTAFGIDEAKNLRRYLNGQVISQTQFETFTNIIKERALLYPNIVTTEENWQAEVTNSKLNQCGKFVIDDALGTIRLPKVVNIQGLSDLALIGSIKAESLPNIKGSFASDNRRESSYTSEPTGIYTRDKIRDWGLAGGDGQGASWVVSSDASRSSSTYQDNAPVRQEAIQYPYFIQVATGVDESVDVLREIELNNPFFFGMSQYFENEPNNASWLISNGSFHSGTIYVSFYKWLLKIYNGNETVDGVSVKASTDIYNDYDFVLNTEETSFRLPNRTKDDFIVESYVNGFEWYKLYKSGWIQQGSRGTEGIVTLPKKMKNTEYSIVCSSHFNKLAADYTENIRDVTETSFRIGIDDGGTQDADYVFWEVTGQSAEIPNNKTYFYVGETIQDANIIAASQVLTDVANLKSYAIGVPDLTACIDITSMETYTFPTDGMLFMYSTGGFIAFGSNKFDTFMGYTYACFGNTNTATSTEYIVVKDETITRKTVSGSYKIFFFPFKGVN